MNKIDAMHPGESGDSIAAALYVHAGVPFDIIRNDLPRLRAEAAARVAALLDFLDATEDTDCDLEANGDDEPSLGWTITGQTLCSGVEPDLESEDENDEPSLGSVENHPGAFLLGRGCSQEGWAAGRSDDRESEHDGCEPDVDDEDGGDGEPSLGWATQDGGSIVFGSTSGSDQEIDAETSRRFVEAAKARKWAKKAATPDCIEFADGRRYCGKTGERLEAVEALRLEGVRVTEAIGYDAGYNPTLMLTYPDGRQERLRRG